MGQMEDPLRSAQKNSAIANLIKQSHIQLSGHSRFSPETSNKKDYDNKPIARADKAEETQKDLRKAHFQLGSHNN